MNWSNDRGFLLLNGLAPRDRRAILVGLCILLPAAVYVLGVKPYRAALAEIMDLVSAEQDLLMRERELLASAESLPLEIEEAQDAADRYRGRLVRATSQVLAEGILSGLLESSAVRSRVLLEEIRGGELARGEEPPPGLSVLRLHLRGESDLEGVLTFLDEIEKNQLLLRVRGLALEPEVARPESDGEGDAPRDPIPTGVIDFQLIVDGFARIEERGP
ncbi:MAG: hypothetical protein PVJ76_05645 [Gemmatimonadota bacterium]|jgi:hypothetical protein